MIVSNKLQWHNQVCAVSSKANSTLNLIARNLQDCPRETRALAYTTLVRPKLEYSASVWDPHLKEDVDTLNASTAEQQEWFTTKDGESRESAPLPYFDI